jgi:tRNA U34 2-thiouridine synthase MnmA/TrmU
MIAKTSVRAPAVGQALVIYKEDRLIGGGLICKGLGSSSIILSNH